jgi:hypothetical protein
VIKAASAIDLIAREHFVKSVARIIDADTAVELFDLLSKIALLPYEEAANSGLLLLCPADCPQELLTLSFEVPFSLQDLRGVRKMLQVSNPQLCLVCDGQKVHGFKAVGDAAPDTLTVQFHPHATWELKEGERTILQINAVGDPPLLDGLDEERFTSIIRTFFGELPVQECQTLWSLVSTAARQLRGTNVLISPMAAAEAERLGNQCTRIKPTLLTPSVMERVTSIDGTVIIDTHGVCHAIGAILDGPAAERGDRTRGGRYNSAVMYVDGSTFPCVIVVVSQNGMIDLVCSPG